MASAPEASAAGPAGPPHPYRWFMLAGVWLLYFSFGVSMIALAPLVYVVMADLGMHRGEMGMVLAAWQLTFILSSLPCGSLLDRFGPRWTMFAASLVVAFSMLLRGFAVDFRTLLAAVMVLGLGGPLIASGAPKVVSLWFAGRERGFALGVYFTGNGCASILTLALTNSVILPALGGDWRNVMFAYAGVIVAAGLAWLAIGAHPESRATEARLKAEEKLPVREVFLQLARDPVVRIVLLMGLFILFYLHGTYHWMPDLLRSYGMTPAEAGYWAALPTLLGMGASLALPRLATPERRFPILLALFACSGVAVFLIWSAWMPLVAAGLVLQGVCRGATTSIALLFLMDNRTSGNRMGAASGLFFSVGEVGGVLGPMSMGAVAHWTGGFDASLFMMAGVAALLVLILLRLRAVRDAS